jgi:hypothetical protein
MPVHTALRAFPGMRFAPPERPWLIAGVVFCVLVKGPGTVSYWVIWGTGVFFSGWLVIALPLVAIGDRVMRLSALALAFAGGFPVV